jgi:hypothetical protein
MCVYICTRHDDQKSACKSRIEAIEEEERWYKTYFLLDRDGLPPARPEVRGLAGAGCWFPAGDEGCPASCFEAWQRSSTAGSVRSGCSGPGHGKPSSDVGVFVSPQAKRTTACRSQLLLLLAPWHQLRCPSISPAGSSSSLSPYGGGEEREEGVDLSR